MGNHSFSKIRLILQGVQLLLEIFPNAKFIHIHRSPYDVFNSANNLHQTLSTLTTLQTIDPERANETVLVLYEQMMKRYLADRELIPSGHLVDVRYEDLEKDPMAVLKEIYASLDLANFEGSIPAFNAFLAAQKSYKKNQYQLSVEAQQKIDQRWAFAFSALGYSVQF